MNTEELVKRNLLLKCYAGSHAYGTSLPTSDVDIRGLFCGDPINVLTPFYPVREHTEIKEEDTKYYELSHFMKLCLDCNPNILELLWVDDSSILYRHPSYDYVRSQREKLLSSKVAFTFSGYSVSQLKRIKNSKKKLNYLPDLEQLCAVLQQALQEEVITEEWINAQCGNNVFEFMKERGFI